MHIFFSGIGGAGVGPLALIAKQAGMSVSGSDRQFSGAIQYLHACGVDNICIGQSMENLSIIHERRPIDWFVYTSALPIDQPDSPELEYCVRRNIKNSKRDEFLNYLLAARKIKLLAVAGTHGKSTTTAMTVWLLKQLGLPVSYSVGARLYFGDMGEFDPASEYFVYEADEYDRNFLHFHPHAALITGIDWDHPDTYPTRDDYEQAFRFFLDQCDEAFIWQQDCRQVGVVPHDSLRVIDERDPLIDTELMLRGRVNRENAWLVAQSVHELTGRPISELCLHLNRFPGLGRRFESIAPPLKLYSDYAHTPPKIRGALQLAREVHDGRLVVVYEGLHNLRQHFIKDDLRNLFNSVEELYIVPSYLAREDPSLVLLTPSDLRGYLSSDARCRTTASQLGPQLADAIRTRLDAGDLVLCLTAGGANSLDSWLRKTFTNTMASDRGGNEA